MSKQVRVTDEAKPKLDELVKFSNENKKSHEPKYNQETWLSEMIEMKYKRVFGDKE